ncbi:sigma-70 family RNA polymerase sigma factor [Edaphobacter albus]|uniref:sigma-70 family RNA polymerase sigma factor n=1 Tax=Edaphobacter sp. 4G125 TaxID=2763071 RepID=UPI001C995318|nr:sigma-70 family RNA polymerase sigma factor [Edaphobacter sp. 4G125]
MEAPPVAPTQQEDMMLLEQVARGEAYALAALYDRYSEMIYAVALRVLRHPTAAEELLEDLFVEIWRSPENISLTRRVSLGAYLIITARNRAIAMLRRRPQSSSSTLAPLLVYDLANETERAVLAEKASFTVANLPRKQRKLFEMALYDGLSLRELAEVSAEPIPLLKGTITDVLFSLREANWV